MNKLGQSSSAQERVVAALEAECGALRALEAACAALPEDSEEMRKEKERIDRAIQLLRAAMAELRPLDGEHSHSGSAGFILAVRRRRKRGDRLEPEP